MKSIHLLTILVLILGTPWEITAQPMPLQVKYPSDLKTGAQRTADYLSALEHKSVAVVANKTSLIGKTHLVDSLLSLGIRIRCVFTPEHGFRGEAGAGDTVADGTDLSTGLPLVSLYGSHKKPTAEDLSGIDVVVFDLQDVGVRFYTYISTLQLVMEACAEQDIPCMVLDRPNPNGFYVDGPVLQKGYSSFVGMNPVPVVYGMTIGEYALMVNGEGWLAGGRTCRLQVIRMLDYAHTDLYQLPVSPSPNLPDMASVYLYPSTCFFEGTRVSLGRGTPYPFRLIGYPGFAGGDTSFMPVSLPGIAPRPPYQDTLCNGIRLDGFEAVYPKTYRRLYLFWLCSMYRSYPDKEQFFLPYFDKLAGNSDMRKRIIAGADEQGLQQDWQKDLDAFRKTRKKYLLYPDFE
jgi:uncharacterized protein YbbC (DUF1343 family)